MPSVSLGGPEVAVDVGHLDAQAVLAPRVVVDQAKAEKKQL
jgi:hypothetical protein